MIEAPRTLTETAQASVREAYTQWRRDPSNEAWCYALNERVMELRKGGTTLTLSTNGKGDITEHSLPPITNENILMAVRLEAEANSGRLILYTPDGTDNLRGFVPSQVVALEIDSHG